MRPRTATIQVYQNEDTNMWHVEIGRPGAALPDVTGMNQDLDKLLTDAIIIWKVKERLGV